MGGGEGRGDQGLGEDCKGGRGRGEGEERRGGGSNGIFLFTTYLYNMHRCESQIRATSKFGISHLYHDNLSTQSSKAVLTKYHIEPMF